MSKRQEGIVVYLTDQTSPEEVEKLLATFSATCPQTFCLHQIYPVLFL